MTSPTSTSLDVEDGHEESLSRLLLRENKHYRELRRIRSSLAFRLGTSIVRALKFPPKLLFLPFTLFYIGFDWGLERIGKKKFISDESHHLPVKNRHCVVMFPTNGVGFGHFTRMLAIAKRMREQDSSLEIIFFTTMPTLHLLKPYGIPAHHISGPKYFKGVDSNQWNALLEEELTLCLETHKPSMFIFDGAFPYRGMLRAIQGRNTLKKIWMRRGMFRKGAKIPVDSIQHFDSIIRPGDAIDESSEEIDHGLEVLTSSPIVLLDQSELLSREQARYRLGLPLDCRAVYVQLGAGQINDISSEIRMTLDELLKIENLHVILGESMIGDRIDIEMPNLHIIRDYPNSQYFNGFDAVIQAGGYNSFHETRAFGLPALFYPNMETGMDDQLARCRVAEKEGWGYVVKERTQKSIREGIGTLLVHAQNRNTSSQANGADELCRQLISHLEVVD